MKTIDKKDDGKLHRVGILKVVSLVMMVILYGCGGSDSPPGLTKNTSWMADIAPVIENQRLNEIILPGTHDSGTYNISGSSVYADDGNPHPCTDIIQNNIGATLENILGKFIYEHTVKYLVDALYNMCNVVQAEWSKAQWTGIGAQLADGIRYIDLRVLQSNGQFFVIHSLVSTDIDTVLGDVKQFYRNSANSKELVILDINHTYHMNTGLDNQLISKIKSTLVDGSGQSLLIPRCSDYTTSCNQPMDLTIKNLWSRSTRQRVIVFYTDSTGGGVVASHPELWYNQGNNSKIISHWPNTTSTDTLTQSLFNDAWTDQRIRNLQANGGFYVLQTIRTPDNGVIENSITTSLWKDMNGTEQALTGWIFDKEGWCKNCATNLLAYGDATNNANNSYIWTDKLFAPRANIIIVDNYTGWPRWTFKGSSYGYVDAVIQMNKSRYCDMWLGPMAVQPGPGAWFGTESQGGDIALRDIDGNGSPDLVAFNIDHPGGGNAGWYRIGWNVDNNGGISSWSDRIQIPGWWGTESQGGGIAIADINGNGKPDLVAFNIDHPGGGNAGWYRVGWDMNNAGIASSWSGRIQIPGWWGTESQGGGIAIADINGNGKPDLVAFNIDHPGGGNVGWYRVGWDMNNAGIAASWSDRIQILGWWGTESQGGGIAIADINGNGKPDLVAFNIDHPGNGNVGWYRVGWDMNNAGISSSWSGPIKIPGWWGTENQGGGIAIADINNNGRPDLFGFNIDHPGNGNAGWYRVGLDMKSDGTISGSRCP